MKVLETEQEKKSFVFTTVTFGLLFLLFFLLKMSNQVALTELEGGGGGGDIAVNFGNSEVGSGDNFQSTEVVRAAPKPVPQAPAVEKEIITSDNDDAPAIADIKKTVDKPKKIEAEKPIVKPVPKPQPSKATNDALSNILNGSDKSGDGNDKTSGNKGKSYGSSDASGYDGGGGSGTGSGGGNGSGQGIGTGSGYGSGSGSGVGAGNGNWKLAGRKLKNSDKVQQKCNEAGRVVVEIKVNRNGDVVGTQYIKGTTNTDPCLIGPAYETARKYKWLPNPDAPEIQVGSITINFSLGE